MRPVLTLRGERTTPDGTLDAAEPTERDSQPLGCPKGKDPARRDLRQRRGLKRLGLVAAKRLPTSTKDAAPIPDLLSSATRGAELDATNRVLVATIRLRLQKPHSL